MMKRECWAFWAILNYLIFDKNRLAMVNLLFDSVRMVFQTPLDEDSPANAQQHPSWSVGDASQFKVRSGPDYMKNGHKTTSGPPMWARGDDTVSCTWLATVLYPATPEFLADLLRTQSLTSDHFLRLNFGRACWKIRNNLHIHTWHLDWLIVTVVVA